MSNIVLNDILRISNLGNVKIRLNVRNRGDGNISLSYRENDRNELLTAIFHNSTKRKWFSEGDIVIGLDQIGVDEWVLFDISKITEDKNKLYDGESQSTTNTFYEYEQLVEYEKYFGRLIIKWRNKTRSTVRRAGSIVDDLLVKEILPNDLIANETFPGYKNVCVGYQKLKKLFDKSDDWKIALKNRKGVYLITDTKTGRQYVGSAYGIDGIFGRWKTYLESGFDKNELENGEYPNKKLQELVKNKGIRYIQDNFQYAILETFTDDTIKEYIIGRELWWKKVLGTREFGYNAN